MKLSDDAGTDFLSGIAACEISAAGKLAAVKLLFAQHDGSPAAFLSKLTHILKYYAELDLPQFMRASECRRADCNHQRR